MRLLDDPAPTIERRRAFVLAVDAQLHAPRAFERLPQQRGADPFPSPFRADEKSFDPLPDDADEPREPRSLKRPEERRLADRVPDVRRRPAPIPCVDEGMSLQIHGQP